jgi:transposase
MIEYGSYTRIRDLAQGGLEAWQIARELDLDVRTVRFWLTQPNYRPRKSVKRTSKLDVFKPLIKRWIEQHAFTGTQVQQMLREEGYRGGVSILRDYLVRVRPTRKEAFLSLVFAPGECAQVDWGCAGKIPVGGTQRRLSFFVMVLCYSRRLYVEFTLSETLEQFLACHQNAFRVFGGVPEKVMVDNLKSAVLSHPAGLPAIYNPRYLDFAGHYGFQVRACNVRAAHEKGRVENAVGYVKKNLLSGLALHDLASIQVAAARWTDEVANRRIHHTTRQTPEERFAQERLRPLPPSGLYDVGRVLDNVVANSQFRVAFDGNRYSVPSRHASSRACLRVYPDKVLIYRDGTLIASHVRSYERGREIVDPDHEKALLEHKRRARDQRIYQRFLALSSQAESYYRQMTERRMHPWLHLRKIVALSEIYAPDLVGRALEDGLELGAFSSEYIANLLEQRVRKLPEPGALHLTRASDLLDLELPETDLSIYEKGMES